MMEAGRRLISPPPSIHPPKTHPTFFLSVSVPVVHDHAAPAVASMPTMAIGRNFPTSVLMQEQIGDYRPSHIIRDSRTQLINSEATLDIGVMRSFMGTVEALNVTNALKILNIRSPSSLREDEPLLPSLLDKIRTVVHKLLDIESDDEAYNGSNLASPGNVLALAKKAVLVSQAATSVAKESNYFSAKPDGSHLHSLVPTELDLDVPVENKPMVKSRRLMQRKSKKRKVSKRPKDATTKVSSFSATDNDKKITSEFHLNDPPRSFLWGLETKELLTQREEHDLFIQIQELTKLEKVKHRLHSQFDREPTLAEWAKASGMSCQVIRSYICSGNSSREKMIIANVRLVFHVAKQYQGQGLCLQDLLQEGIIGLMKSLEKFKPQAGCRFSSYAYWWIKQSIRTAIVYDSRTIRLPEHVYSLVGKINKAKKACRQEGCCPTDKELAKRVGITTAKCQLIMSRTRSPTSLKKNVWPSNSGWNITFEDITADPMVEPPVEVVAKQLMRQHIHDVLGILTVRERQIMQLRYGIHDGRPKSLSEIGTVYGLTKERIRQLESVALTKLRQVQGLEAYISLVI